MNQKIAPDCSRGSSRKQYSRFLMWKLRGSAFCRNLSCCLLHLRLKPYNKCIAMALVIVPLVDSPTLVELVFCLVELW